MTQIPDLDQRHAVRVAGSLVVRRQPVPPMTVAMICWFLATACTSPKQRVRHAQQQMQQAHFARVIEALGAPQSLPQGVYYGAFAPGIEQALAVGHRSGRQLVRAEVSQDRCDLHFFNGQHARLEKAAFDAEKMPMPPVVPNVPRDTTAFYSGQFDDGTPVHLKASVTDGRIGSVQLLPDDERPVPGHLMLPGPMHEQVVPRNAVAQLLAPAGSVAGCVRLPEFADLGLTNAEVNSAVQDLVIKRHQQGPYYLLDVQRFDVSTSTPDFARIDAGRSGVPLRVDLFFPHGSRGLVALHGVRGHHYQERNGNAEDNVLVLEGGFSADLFQHAGIEGGGDPMSFYALVMSESVTATGPLRTNRDVYDDTLEPLVRRLVMSAMQRLLTRSMTQK